MRILIVDDEPLARERVRSLVAELGRDEVIGQAGDGPGAIDAVQNLNPDLVLLDIRMPDMDGIEAARQMLATEHPPSVIFTTAYDGYALKAFEMQAIDYLVKPIRLQRLHDALKRVRRAVQPPDPAQELLAPARTHIAVTERGRVALVQVDRILYMRAEQKYVCLKTPDREYLLEESLSRLEQEFSDSFVRVHRNCLVSRAHIEGFERAEEGHWMVRLRGVEQALPVSRRQQHVVRQVAS